MKNLNGLVIVNFLKFDILTSEFFNIEENIAKVMKAPGGVK
jgi:hypothetical protein